MSGINEIVLAYSGGLDTSAIIPWLKENYDAEIIAFVADVGQERDDLEGIEQKAIASGATKCIVKDLREEFVKEYVYPTLKTGAVYEGTYLRHVRFDRPLWVCVDGRSNRGMVRETAPGEEEHKKSK